MMGFKFFLSYNESDGENGYGYEFLLMLVGSIFKGIEEFVQDCCDHNVYYKL